ncbi:MAG: pyridoxamine 5'-phosphate oxidase family protein [Lentisphaeria bacterium]
MHTHSMRRDDRAIDENRIRDILNKGEYGVLSTVDNDGTPYGVPLSYAFDGNKIYFHCAKDVGHKLVNIASQKKVSFTVVGETSLLPAKFSTEYQSAIAFGIANEVLAIDEKKKIAFLLIQKYSPDFIESGNAYIERAIDKTGIYEITITKVTGKSRNPA